MLASASHEPEQHDWHWAWQSALGGVASHRASQLPAHVDLQEARHSAVFLVPTQVASQLPLQSARHAVAHSNFPGSTAQSASHVAAQLAVHEASIITLH
jgi:hypothetical protein